MSSRIFRSINDGSPPRTPIRQTSFTSSRWSPISMGSDESKEEEFSDEAGFWTPPKARTGLLSWRVMPQMRGFNWIGSWGLKGGLRGLLPSRRTGVLVFMGVLVVFMFSLTRRGGESLSVNGDMEDGRNGMHGPTTLRPVLAAIEEGDPDPMRWLRENSGDKHAVGNAGAGGSWKGMVWGDESQRNRPRAALITLVRNSELEGIVQSMEQLEYRWNRKYQYPWIFFNDEPFTDEFKNTTKNLTSAKCFYEVVPKEHWSLPDWIDENRFMNSLEYLGSIGVGKGWLVSYHHMCRWNSGFFYKHPILKEYDWYWRVEPDVHYFCDIDYDIFRFMRDNNMKYGFNMAILDDARSFPSLWKRTLSFATANPHLLHTSADISWLLDPENGGDYNNCQFFSNFEIGSLNFWRDTPNEEYFNYLDRTGGFYYERFGDAPVHTLSVGMFVPKKEVWWFRDVGYQHGINRHCPPPRKKDLRSSGLGDRNQGDEGLPNKINGDELLGRTGRCDCESTGLDEGFYKLVPLESPQKKPGDTCLRLWLGGEWLGKKEGWTAEGEKAFGGDGYAGYVLRGDE